MRLGAFARGVLLTLVCAWALAGCAGRPIDWQRWHAPPLPDDAAEILRLRMRAVEERLWRDHISPEGLLLYRIPAVPDPVAGSVSELADQACWSGYLLAALSLHHAVEPSEQLRGRIRTVVGGLELLERVTGEAGLIARCVAPRSIVPTIARRPERWFPARDGSAFAFRGDVSKDQYAGFVFGLLAAAAVVDDGDVHARCVRLLERIALRLHRDGLRIRDHRGRVTPYGDMRGRIFGVPIGVHSAFALALFRGAARFSDDRRVRRAATARTNSLLASLRPLHFEVLGLRNYSNATMAAASVAAIALVEENPRVLRQVRGAYRPFLDAFAGEGNTLFNGVGGLLGLDGDSTQRGIRNLHYAPLSGELREVTRETYASLPRRLLPGRRGGARSAEAIPLLARPASSFRWRSDPFDLDRKVPSRGELVYSGVDLLTAYWLVRYARSPAPESRAP